MTSDPPESDSAIASAFANVARDEEGYLLKPEDWNAQIAELCARICNIELSDTHWSLVYFIRHYFETNQRVPQTRHVLKIIAAEAAHHGISPVCQPEPRHCLSELT